MVKGTMKGQSRHVIAAEVPIKSSPIKGSGSKNIILPLSAASPLAGC